MLQAKEKGSYVEGWQKLENHWPTLPMERQGPQALRSLVCRGAVLFFLFLFCACFTDIFTFIDVLWNDESAVLWLPWTMMEQVFEDSNHPGRVLKLGDAVRRSRKIVRASDMFCCCNVIISLTMCVHVFYQKHMASVWTSVLLLWKKIIVQLLFFPSWI
jgi:hypothetical protein